MSYIDTLPAGNGGRLMKSPPQSAQLAGLPPGRDGTIATLKHMRTFVRDALRDPSQVIRRKALDILAINGVAPRAYTAELRALHRFVRDEITYRRDPVNLELVQTPERTLQERAGDCDDKSTLLAALLMATGHPARFKALGFKGNGFSHVITEVKRGAQWVPLETILPGKAPGWFPPGVTSQYILEC